MLLIMEAYQQLGVARHLYMAPKQGWSAYCDLVADGELHGRLGYRRLHLRPPP